MIHTEPNWKSYLVETTEPIFTPEQCDIISKLGRSMPPQNGQLQILGASSGQFAKIDYQPPMDLRDFYVFPYDMRHCVYPFNSTQDTRRTLAANCDVLYDPIRNRGAI